METLRFAPLIRVSTEKQEKKGESLTTQKAQIIQYVKSIPNGVIPDSCWDYSGQEHATPDQERKKLDKLLSDTSKGIFDAIIVCDASRWSRDNKKSKEGLQILRDNGIRFFVGTMESDLYNPAQNLFLGMSAEIGEFQAFEQARKSITNRIHRARRGIPTVGALPYGRKFNKETGKFEIDEDKKKLIEQAVKRYIAGERFEDISKSVGIHYTTLWKIFKNKLGTEWHLSFVNKKVNVNETVIMSIPALIDDPKILAEIKERLRINTTYTRGNRKYYHILSGYIFCGRCGSKLQAHVNAHGKNARYYFHWRLGNNGCKFRKMVNATELENSVLLNLVKTFGDYQMIEKAIQRATPDMARTKALDQEGKQLTKELLKVTNQKSVLIKKIADELISDDEAKLLLEDFREREKAIKLRLSTIDSELTPIPDVKHVKALSRWAGKIISSVTKNDPSVKLSIL
jgi:DNA invertase Pin-like site-specific DNA recombinase